MNRNSKDKISREQLATMLRRDVIDGCFKEGEPVREQHLAERYGVKRGTVRDALLTLSVQGLLEFTPNCGTTIRRPPNEDIRPLIVTLRLQIEEYVVNQFFDQLQEITGELDRILEGMHQACMDGRERELAKFDLRFHRTIIESSNDKEVIALWHSIIYRMILHYSRLARIEDSYTEHRAIVDQIKAGNKKEAIKQLRANIS